MVWTLSFVENANVDQKELLIKCSKHTPQQVTESISQSLSTHDNVNRRVISRLLFTDVCCLIRTDLDVYLPC